MANQPVLTFRDNTPQANVISQITYVFSTLGSNFLPVLQGTNSLTNVIRVFNNYALSQGVAAAMNVGLVTFDGMGTANHTASTPIVSQSWVRAYETGWGEGSTIANIPYSQFAGSDTAIGGNPAGANVYFAEMGSDGTYSGEIRAGNGGKSGLGFIEFTTYVQVPEGAFTYTWNFALDVLYEWTS